MVGIARWRTTQLLFTVPGIIVGLIWCDMARHGTLWRLGRVYRAKERGACGARAGSSAAASPRPCESEPVTLSIGFKLPVRTCCGWTAASCPPRLAQARGVLAQVVPGARVAAVAARRALRGARARGVGGRRADQRRGSAQAERGARPSPCSARRFCACMFVRTLNTPVPPRNHVRQGSGRGLELHPLAPLLWLSCELSCVVWPQITLRHARRDPDDQYDVDRPAADGPSSPGPRSAIISNPSETARMFEPPA